MREVAIIGIGKTAVDEHWDKSLRELATDAILNALGDARRDKVDGIFVGNMMSGMVSRYENPGTLIADWAGLRGVEAFKDDLRLCRTDERHFVLLKKAHQNSLR